MARGWPGTSNAERRTDERRTIERERQPEESDGAQDFESRWSDALAAPAVRAGCLVGLFALGALTSLQSAAPPAATTLAVAGRANANVSLVADGSFVAAVWSGSTAEGMTDIFTSVSRDGGLTFGAPTRVNSTPGDARVNGEQPPRVTLAARAGQVPQIVAIWTSKSSGGTALRTARSNDGGKTFSPSSLVTGTDAAGNRGWEAIGADRQGVVHAVWLDHRRMAAPDASTTAAAHRHGAHAEGGGAPKAMAKPDGVAMAQQSDLYFDTLGDDTAPRALTPGVCYCCKTAIAFGANHEIYLAWRHVYPGNFRDMAFTLSRDGGRSFAAAATGESGQLDARGVSRTTGRR